MPAASEGSTAGPGLPALPVTWRPLGPRIAAFVGVASLIVIMFFLWLSFDDATREAVSWLQRATVVAMFGLAFACLNALARCKVVASDDGLVVVNGYRRREFDWAQVVAVHLPPGAPWVTLDLSDGTTVSAMGIQGSDGDRARQAVRGLRALLAERSQA